ncbi:MAG: TonB-dependent receptor [Rhodanobacter sp.]|jgi:outer membrane receptor protein involved in Fe transport|nr:TonB-dependent receptor [Rhodanobacter sp.]
MNKTTFVLCLGLALARPGSALADPAPPPAPVTPSSAANAAGTTNTATRNAKSKTADSADTTLTTISVSVKLDQSRNQLSPDVGSSQYVFDKNAIGQLPQGDATPLNQILLRAPGVVNDSLGQLHVRGDHADLQYRINGIIIPESIGGFGQALDARIVDKLSLLTGALPAQYGYRTAGVVDITTKSAADGDTLGGSVGLTAGSFGTFNPSVDVHGSNGPWSGFFSANFLKNDVGIENPTPARNAIHDHTDQIKAFGYLSYVLNDSARLSFLFGATNNRFQIPNNPAQQPAYQLGNITQYDSSTLDQRQFEKNVFGALALQGHLGDTDYQVSIGQRYTSVNYQPDPIGDLVFNGIAGTIARNNRANTLQTDFSTPLSSTHTLRYGLYASSEHPIANSASLVFPADNNGHQTSTTPITIIDHSPSINARTYGVYVQDEWQATDKLTVNYGLRGDKVNAYVSEGQWSPRLGLVYQATDSTVLHAGYARYFTPPPTELISAQDIALFNGTTNQLPNNVNAQTLSERSHYYDAGVSQKIGDHLTLGLDAYYRSVTHLLDEGQFGQALIYSPFNYARGRIRGIEFTANYDRDGFSAYFNLASGRATGKNVVTGQYNFTPEELDYIATHWVHLDHDQRLTSSGGLSYDWNGTRLGADYLYGSGLRAGFANTEHLPQYYSIDLSVARTFDLPSLGKLAVRLAAINITDRVYVLRDGTGIGVGAPQYGPRRGLYLGLQKDF